MHCISVGLRYKYSRMSYLYTYVVSLSIDVDIVHLHSVIQMSSKIYSTTDWLINISIYYYYYYHAYWNIYISIEYRPQRRIHYAVRKPVWVVLCMEQYSRMTQANAEKRRQHWSRRKISWNNIIHQCEGNTHTISTVAVFELISCLNVNQICHEWMNKHSRIIIIMGMTLIRLGYVGFLPHFFCCWTKWCYNIQHLQLR